MRIGLDIRALKHPRYSGVENYILNLAIRLPEVSKKNRFFYYSDSQLSSKIDPSIKLIDKTNLIHRTIPLSRGYGSLGLSVCSLVDQIDVMHYPVTLLPKITLKPSIATVYDLTFEYFPDFYDQSALPQLRRSIRESVRRADHIISDSESTKSDLIKFYNVPDTKITSIYLGVDEGFFQTWEREIQEKVSRLYNLPQKYVLFVGNIQPRKNLSSLVLALARNKNLQDHNLVVVGKKDDDAEFKKVQDQVKKSFVEDRVFFLDYVNNLDLPVIYSLSSCFAFPSHYEGFGLPVLEAMASGVPVVASNKSSIPEIIGTGEGILINPDDVDDISRGLEKAILSDLRTDIIKNGKRRASDFTWDETARKTVLVYERFGK